MHRAGILWLFDENFLASAFLTTTWRLPRLVHAVPALFDVLYAVLIHQVTLIKISQRRMIRLEGGRSVRAIERVHEVLLLGRIVIHVVNPTVPGGRNLLGLRREQVTIVGVLDPAALILAVSSEVLIVPVAELVLANHGHDLVGETGLLVSRPVGLTTEDGAHKTFLAIELPEFRSQETNR